MKRFLCLASLLLVLGMAVCGEQLPPGQKIQKLLADLDHPTYSVREKAQQELIRLGEDAVPALKAALKKKPSPEVAQRLEKILAKYRPPVYEAHASGWHWVYSWITHAQTFESVGTDIKSLQLRVAQLNANRPAAPLEVEIRDLKLETIYVRGTIGPEVLQQEFRWQPVALKHVTPLKPGETYALVFYSRDSKHTGPWAINAIYQNAYPHGHHWYTHHEDFFFDMTYKDGKSIRVGPKGENTTHKLPINSGAEGGNVENGGPLQLQSFGVIPAGKLAPLPERKNRKEK